MQQLLSRRFTLASKKTDDTTQVAKQAGTRRRVLPWLLIVCGAVGLIASLALTFDKMQLLQHPQMQFNCDLNPVINCGSVMESDQANVFGLINPIIGLVGFPVVITTGVIMLAGAKLKRWYWLSMEVGLTLGVLFAYWLLFESIFSIGALCPWCLTTDVAITTAWWYLTLYLVQEGHLSLPKQFRRISSLA